MSAVFTIGGFELIGRIEPLWMRLRDHHARNSPHFSKELADATFEQRKEDFLRKGESSALFVCIASAEERDVGYVVASIIGSSAEIDSVYVLDSAQGKGVGTELMRRALDWLKSHQATSVYVNVAYGNTPALNFYRKFGVFPRSINLYMKN